MLFNVGWPNAPHRVLRNKAIEEWEAAGRPESGRRLGESEIVGRMTRLGAPFDVPRYSPVPPMTDFEGDLEHVALYAGESCELVNDVKPAAAIVRDVVREAEEVLKTLGG
jgi:nitronate monooxygenase/enoyl-[acyl-carrier protein] reductase II